MKLNNLSAKKICRLISTGMVFSMLVITGIFGGIMQDTRIFIAGGTLTLCAFFWIWLLVLFFGKRLSHFTSNLCRTLDNMINGGDYTMTIGERIKKIRVFRKMTMDELGGALGFEGKNMSVRISQYETGARIPGEDMILKLADALRCNYKAISDYSLGAAEDIIETLFWLEESATSLPARGKGTRFPEYTAPGNLIHLTAMTPAKSSETARPTYNEDDYDSAGSPVALTFEYGLVNDFLSEWCEMKTKLNSGEISPNEYFEWKITWPQA